MTLIQKLPLGLALAACMVMSSCSQEDVAQPQSEKVTNGFNADRGFPPGFSQNFSIPTTTGPTGLGALPTGWKMGVCADPSDYTKYGVGTSSYSNIMGSSILLWYKTLPLPGPSGAIGDEQHFVTFMRQKNFLKPNTSTYSTVKAEIKNLTPGKKYAFTIKVATGKGDKDYVQKTTQYAPGIRVEVDGNTEVPGSPSSVISLVGKEAVWVSKTITFVAQSPSTEVEFSTYADQAYDNAHSEYFNYGSVYIGKDAIVEVP